MTELALKYGATGSLEMLLLLLWRHLVFYGEGLHVNNPDLRGSISHTMRFASSPDADTLKSEAARKLTPVIQKLQSLELVSIIAFNYVWFMRLRDVCYAV